MRRALCHHGEQLIPRHPAILSFQWHRYLLAFKSPQTMRAMAHINVATVSNKGIGKGVTAACSVTEVVDFCRFIGGFAPASERKNPRILTYMTFFYQPRYLHGNKIRIVKKARIKPCALFAQLASRWWPDGRWQVHRWALVTRRQRR